MQCPIRSRNLNFGQGFGTQRPTDAKDALGSLTSTSCRIVATWTVYSLTVYPSLDNVLVDSVPQLGQCTRWCNTMPVKHQSWQFTVYRNQIHMRHLKGKLHSKLCQPIMSCVKFAMVSYFWVLSGYTFGLVLNAISFASEYHCMIFTAQLTDISLE